MSDFDRAEREYLTPPELTEEVLEYCENCNESLLGGDYVYTDNSGYIFCDFECLAEYNGIKKFSLTEGI